MTQRPRHALLLTGGVVVLILLAVLGYALWAARDDADEQAPSAGGQGPVPTIGPPPANAPPGGPATPPAEGTTPPAEGTTPPPAGRTTPPADRTTPPADRTTAPPAGRPTPPRRDPRLVGPTSAGGFEKLLGEFCQERDFRTALLLEGADGTRRTGDWVCVQAITFEAINLDAACRQEFGGQTRARRLEPRDSTTWRCFDS